VPDGEKYAGAMSERSRQPAADQTAVSAADVTLVDEMLRLSVKQRLEQNDRMATEVVRLRAAFEVAKGKDGWTSRGS
jgi:hypothetical protein